VLIPDLCILQGPAAAIFAPEADDGVPKACFLAGPGVIRPPPEAPLMLYHDLRSLRIFLLACEMRSRSKAAETLNIALSAASRRLRRLEEEAGTRLITRRPQGVGLGNKLRVNLNEHRSGNRGSVRISAWSSVLVPPRARYLSDVPGSY
jgi:hypothetical protein